MEGDRDPACLSPFTALWTWTRNGYHMADEGERRGEPCVNPAEFMGDKEEVKKKKAFSFCEGGFADLLFWDVCIHIFF